MKERECIWILGILIRQVKDDFPLAHLDGLIDNTIDHGIFFVMDGYASYNQVKMETEHMEKTTLIILLGIRLLHKDVARVKKH